MTQSAIYTLLSRVHVNSTSVTTALHPQIWNTCGWQTRTGGSDLDTATLGILRGALWYDTAMMTFLTPVLESNLTETIPLVLLLGVIAIRGAIALSVP